MPVFRVPWAEIKARITGLGLNPGDLALFALPIATPDILMGLLGDRLHWQATYRIDGYDFADWDDLEQLGSLIEIQQGDHIMLADLLTSLDGILAAIQAINPCCGPETQITSDVQTTWGDVPDSLIAEYPTWTDFQEDYLCRVGNYIVDAFKLQVADLSTATSTGSITLGVVAAIVGVLTLGIGWMFIFSVSVMLALLAGALALGETALDDLADDLETARDDLVCVFVNATTAANLKIAWDTAIDNMSMGTDATTVAKYLLQPAMCAAIFNGEIEGETLDLSGYTTASCDDCVTYKVLFKTTGSDGTIVNAYTYRFAGAAITNGYSATNLGIHDEGQSETPPGAGKYHFTINSVTLHSGSFTHRPGYSNVWRVWSDNYTTLIYDSDTPPTNLDNAYIMTVQSAVAYNCTIVTSNFS